MPQSFACLHCHVIFSTKNRELLILPAWASRLYEYIGGIARAKYCVLISANGMPDHVHLLVSLCKQICVSDIIRDIKSNSSHWIYETFDNLRGFAWQSGYGAFAVSYSNIDSVRNYIKDQREHHRVRSFQEELIAFLKRHRIEYDERYIWD
jgi:putative transposase